MARLTNLALNIDGKNITVMFRVVDCMHDGKEVTVLTKSILR